MAMAAPLLNGCFKTCPLLSPSSLARLRPSSAFASLKSDVEVIPARKSAPPNSRGASRVITLEVDNLAKVFCDESRGIVCYRNESGEVTCEGFDEGPHFHPASQQQQQEEASRVACSRIFLQDFYPFIGDQRRYISIKEYMGSLFCEGKDES